MVPLGTVRLSRSDRFRDGYRVEPNSTSMFETRFYRTRTEQRFCSTRTRFNRANWNRTGPIFDSSRYDSTEWVHRLNILESQSFEQFKLLDQFSHEHISITIRQKVIVVT